MKIWKGFGSGHSARLTIVGEFTSVEDAKIMRELIDDFVNGIQNEKYRTMEEFWNALGENRVGEFARMIRWLGATKDDFEMGLDDTVDVERSDKRVSTLKRYKQNPGTRWIV